VFDTQGGSDWVKSSKPQLLNFTFNANNFTRILSLSISPAILAHYTQSLNVRCSLKRKKITNNHFILSFKVV